MKDQWTFETRCPLCGAFNVSILSVDRTAKDSDEPLSPWRCDVCRSTGFIAVRVGELRKHKPNRVPGEDRGSAPKPNEYVKHVHADPRNKGK